MKLYQLWQNYNSDLKFGEIGRPAYRTLLIKSAGLLSALIMPLPYSTQGLECFANQLGLNVLRRNERRGKALFVHEYLSTIMQKSKFENDFLFHSNAGKLLPLVVRSRTV